jgi:hypothetical protein
MTKQATPAKRAYLLGIMSKAIASMKSTPTNPKTLAIMLVFCLSIFDYPQARLKVVGGEDDFSSAVICLIA